MNVCPTVDFQFPLEEPQVFDLFEQDLLYLFLRRIVERHCENFQAHWIGMLRRIATARNKTVRQTYFSIGFIPLSRVSKYVRGDS